MEKRIKQALPQTKRCLFLNSRKMQIKSTLKNCYKSNGSNKKKDAIKCSAAEQPE
jgi:hypothetical protein